MKIAIIGGHMSPALAIIEKLKDDELYYFGRKHGFEGDKAISLEYLEINKLGIPFFSINTARLQRSFSKHTFPSLMKFPLGFYQSIKILRRIKPDVVIGFGGYVSIPVVMAASFLKIPIVIHEQTLDAGFANRFNSRFAKKICISWKSSSKHFPLEKTVLTGNPLREEIIIAGKNKKAANKLPLIYVTGGSSGAHFINSLIKNNLSSLISDYEIFHQTGDSKEFNDFESLEKLKSELKESVRGNYTIGKFLTSKEAAEILAKADLVVGRSGINTVTELIYLGKPAFLVPLPFAQANEQLVNAELLKKVGLGEYLRQMECDDSSFVTGISQMVKNINKYKLTEEVLVRDSAEKVVRILKDVAKKTA